MQVLNMFYIHARGMTVFKFNNQIFLLALATNEIKIWLLSCYLLDALASN